MGDGLSVPFIVSCYCLSSLFKNVQEVEWWSVDLVIFRTYSGCDILTRVSLVGSVSRNKVVCDALTPLKLTFLMTLFFCNPIF